MNPLRKGWNKLNTLGKTVVGVILAAAVGVAGFLTLSPGEEPVETGRDAAVIVGGGEPPAAPTTEEEPASEEPDTPTTREEETPPPPPPSDNTPTEEPPKRTLTPDINNPYGDRTFRPNMPVEKLPEDDGSRPEALNIPAPENPIPPQEANLPPNFPLPEGLLIAESVDNHGTITVTMWTPTMDVAEFFKEQLPLQGYYITQKRIDPNFISSQITFSGGGIGVTPARMIWQGNKGTLTWTKKAQPSNDEKEVDHK